MIEVSAPRTRFKTQKAQTQLHTREIWKGIQGKTLDLLTRSLSWPHAKLQAEDRDIEKIGKDTSASVANDQVPGPPVKYISYDLVSSLH